MKTQQQILDSLYHSVDFHLFCYKASNASMPVDNLQNNQSLLFTQKQLANTSFAYVTVTHI